MAFDKVIDSTALDAGMTATANAIREKTGGTGPIMWDVSNGFKNAVEAIQASGGGIPYATGSFTLAVEANRPVITHNLNSTKVFVMYSVRENPAIYTRRYSAIMGVLISNGAYPTRTIDISSYTTRTDITEVIAGPDNKKNHTYIDVIAPYNGDDYFGTGDGYFANTDPNSFILYTREVFLAGLTFDWVAVDISGVLPWAEEG